MAINSIAANVSLKRPIKLVWNSILALRNSKSLRDIPVPVIIGASGGSGTRLITRIVQHSGWFMGSRLNHAMDSKDTGAFLRLWLPHFLEHRGHLTAKVTRLMDLELNAALIRHRSAISDPQMAWGFKNPRAMLLIPYFEQRFGSLRFIHVVRDGRDMAFTNNQADLQRYGRFFLDASMTEAPLPLQLIDFWAKTNSQVNLFASEHLGNRYLRLRFEDVCNDPRKAIGDIYSFLDLDYQNLESAAAFVRPPNSIGRWQSQPNALQEQLINTAGEALAHFGYL